GEIINQSSHHYVDRVSSIEPTAMVRGKQDGYLVYVFTGFLVLLYYAGYYPRSVADVTKLTIEGVIQCHGKQIERYFGDQCSGEQGLSTVVEQGMK
ncbi:hypothetical protein DFH28DRAFT_874797, partial [Melampsora americana]